MSVVSTRAGDGGSTVTIDRPEALQRPRPHELAELADAFAALEHDAEVHCAILTGAGDKAFVAGADIAEMAELTPTAGAALRRAGAALGDHRGARSR